MKPANLKNLDSLKFPLLASPKLDGIRGILTSNGMLSNSLKKLPNVALQESVTRLVTDFPETLGLDGELMLPKGNFNAVQSAVMSRDSKAILVFWVFDSILEPNKDYFERFLNKNFRLSVNLPNLVLRVVPNYLIDNVSDLKRCEENFLDRGYEGVILRNPKQPYKFGRSTLREGTLMKLKRFTDAEGTIVGYEEQYANGNLRFTNELGLTARATLKEHKVPKNTLGVLLLDTKEYGTIRVGTGITDELRKEIWYNKEKYLGTIVTYKYFSTAKNKPRHPVFHRFRSKIDHELH